MRRDFSSRHEFERNNNNIIYDNASWHQEYRDALV